MNDIMTLLDSGFLVNNFKEGKHLGHLQRYPELQYQCHASQQSTSVTSQKEIFFFLIMGFTEISL